MDPHHAATWRHPLVIAALDAIMARHYRLPESRATITITDRLDMQLTPDGWTVGDFIAGRPMRHSCGECGLVHEAPAVP